MIEILEKYKLTEAGKDYAWFDCESFDDSDNYLFLFENLSDITKGKFQPQKIKINEGWTENKEYYIVEINFEWKTKNRTIKVLCEEWFDFDLITDLNKILREEGIKEQFYPIKTEDQSLIITFIDRFLKEKLSYENFIEDEKNIRIEKNENFKTLKIKHYR